jgi:xylulokinase
MFLWLLHTDVIVLLWLMQPIYLLLDIGGTDIKTAFTSLNQGDLINLRRQKFPSFLDLGHGLREVDPIELLHLVEKEISQQLHFCNNVAGILISSQMACWILSDKSGREVTNLVSWQDNRSLLLQERTVPRELIEINGGEYGSGLPALGVQCLIEELPYSPSEISFETLSSWIIRKLSSEQPLNISHITDAAATGLLDIVELKWRADLLSKELEEIAFPQIQDAIVSTSRFKDSLIPLYVGVGDQQASLLGAGIDDSILVVNIGTGGQVASLGRRKSEQLQERPFFNSKYITTKTHLPAGRLLSKIIEVLSIHFGYITTYEELALWEINGDDVVSSNKLKVENCEETLLHLVDAGYEINEAVSLLLRSLARIYVSYIAMLRTEAHTKIVFAGGVGQKFTNLQALISSESKLDYEVSETQETTLAGLAKLTIDLQTSHKEY